MDTSANSEFISTQDSSPLVSKNVFIAGSDSNLLSALLSPISNALYETDLFLSRHDPLKFPAADAVPVLTVSIPEKNGTQDDVVSQTLLATYVDLDKNNYNVTGKTDWKKFIDNSKKALVEFYDSYKSKSPELKYLARNILVEKIK